MLVKAIYLPEDLKGEDITGTVPFDAIDSLHAETPALTLIALQSGRFAAVRQSVAELEAAFAKAVAAKQASLDLTALCLDGDAARAIAAQHDAAERLAYEHQQRVIARWMQFEDFLQGKKKKDRAPLTAADIRGIAALKERRAARAAESRAESGAVRNAAVRHILGYPQRALGRLFNRSQAPQQTAKSASKSQAKPKIKRS